MLQDQKANAQKSRTTASQEQTSGQIPIDPGQWEPLFRQQSELWLLAPASSKANQARDLILGYLVRFEACRRSIQKSAYKLFHDFLLFVLGLQWLYRLYPFLPIYTQLVHFHVQFTTVGSNLGPWFDGSTIRRIFLLVPRPRQLLGSRSQPIDRSPLSVCFIAHNLPMWSESLDLLPQVWLELSVHIGVGLTCRRRRLTKTHKIVAERVMKTYENHASQALRFISSLGLCPRHLANFLLDLRPQVRQGEVLSDENPWAFWHLNSFCKTKQLAQLGLQCLWIQLGLRVSLPLLLLLLPLECPLRFQPGIWRYLVWNHFTMLLSEGYMLSFCHSGVLVLQGCLPYSHFKGLSRIKKNMLKQKQNDYSSRVVNTNSMTWVIPVWCIHVYSVFVHAHRRHVS